MKTLMAAAIRCSLLFLVPTVTYAISAQWDLDPISGDWNTAANWMPDVVPNGPADTATFGLSNMTNVSISANTEVNGITFTPAASSPYTIMVSPDVTLTLSGTGITNNSGIAQRFFVGDPIGEQVAQMNFTNSASAGNATIRIGFGSVINFFDRSTAAGANLEGEGFININFFNNSTAGSASIDGDFDMHLNFFDNSTAGSATVFGSEDAKIRFLGHSSAGTATVQGGSDEGIIDFSDFSTAGSATVIGFGTSISFSDLSKGGTAQIELLFNEFDEDGTLLDISSHSAPGVTIGSLEGDEGTFGYLGSNNLTIGSNNLSTTYSGVIQDGGIGGGTGGSLSKIGSGTLVLSGHNTYTGNTNINRGVLQVDGSITSDTFVNQRGTLAGIGTIDGNLTNNGRVSPGSTGAPGVLTVTGDYTQTQFATLMIQIAGASDFSVLNVLGNANLSGFLDPVLLNGFVPMIGDTFTFLNYGSLIGECSRIQHQVFDNGMLQWSVIYEADYAILTVGPNTIPDAGSTVPLLGLGLLGLLTYGRTLLRAKRNQLREGT